MCKYQAPFLIPVGGLLVNFRLDTVALLRCYLIDVESKHMVKLLSEDLFIQGVFLTRIARLLE